jgi:excisionase family DNA binding protein
MEKAFYTINEAAELLGVTRKTIYQWMDSGRLAFVVVGERRRITQDAMQAFIQASTQRAAEVTQKIKRPEL